MTNKRFITHEPFYVSRKDAAEYLLKQMMAQPFALGTVKYGRSRKFDIQEINKLIDRLVVVGRG